MAHGVAIDAMGEPIGGDVPVDQRIALDLRMRMDATDAERRRLPAQAAVNSAVARMTHPTNDASNSIIQEAAPDALCPQSRIPGLP